MVENLKSVEPLQQRKRERERERERERLGGDAWLKMRRGFRGTSLSDCRVAGGGGEGEGEGKKRKMGKKIEKKSKR